MCSCNSNNEPYHYDVRRSNITRQNASNYKGKGLTISQASRKAAVDNVNATEAYLYKHGNIEVTWKD